MNRSKNRQYTYTRKGSRLTSKKHIDDYKLIVKNNLGKTLEPIKYKKEGGEELSSSLSLSEIDAHIENELVVGGNLTCGTNLFVNDALQLGYYVNTVTSEGVVPGDYPYDATIKTNNSRLFIEALDVFFNITDDRVFFRKEDDGGNLWNFEIDLEHQKLLFREASDINLDYSWIEWGAHGYIKIKTSDFLGSIGYIGLEADGYINLEAATQVWIDSTNVTNDWTDGTLFKNAGTTFGSLTTHHAGSTFTLFEAAGDSTDDYFAIDCYTDGISYIRTWDDSGANAHLKLIPDGGLFIEATGDIGIEKGVKLYLDSDVGTDALGSSYIDSTHDVSGDEYINFRAGGGNQLSLKNETNASYAGFPGMAGFPSRPEAVYNAADTELHFAKYGNKQYLEMSGDITDMNIVMPEVSCNCLVYIRLDGGWSVSNWKVWVKDLLTAANGSATVLWPGGTAPSLTASGKDVISFYWDAEEEFCFGQAGLNFQ